MGLVSAAKIACLAAPIAVEVRRVRSEPALESLQGSGPCRSLRSEDLRPGRNPDNEGRKLIMSERDAFDRILASSHEAMLDDAHWLPTSALIDDACRTKGNMLTFAEGQTQDDVDIFYIRFCFRGEHHKELEREYFKHYFPWDERIPRLRQLPDSQLFSRSRPLHRAGAENLPGIQRGAARRRHSERSQCAYGRAEWLAHRLGDLRSCRHRRLVVRSARHDQASSAPTSANSCVSAKRCGCRGRIDPELVMAALDLTPAESQVAVMLAEGRTPEISQR